MLKLPSRDADPAQTFITNMASIGTSSTDLISGEDLEAILDALEDDEEFEVFLDSTVDEVQNEGDISCEFCSKVCKSKRGLSRHVSTKHKDKAKTTVNKEPTLKYSVFRGLFNDTTSKIARRDVFHSKLKDEIRSYSLKLEESSREFKDIQTIFESFYCKGNCEAFYSKFYGQIALNSTSYFQGISQRAATLLATKLADTLLSFAKSEKNVEAKDDSLTPPSENELAAMQYLGGYVLQSLHKKHRTSKHKAKSESQQAISILSACKQLQDDSQILINCLNRGGLWSPTSQAQDIFKRTEHHFRLYTAKDGLRSIDHEQIVIASVKDPQITSVYNIIISDAELEISNSVGKDILNSIVSLYVKVRSFSHAKDIVQKYKIKQKQGKAKALRKELERSSQEERQV